MQTAQPRDLGALLLVVGVFLILFVVTLTLGVARSADPDEDRLDPVRVGRVQVAAEPERAGELHRHEPVRPRDERPRAGQRTAPPRRARAIASTIGVRQVGEAGRVGWSSGGRWANSSP